MAHIFMHHQVEDDDTWRPHFDADQAARAAAGARDVAVLRDADDPNSVWLVIEADPSILEPMMNDPARGEAMRAAGVASAPRMWVAP
jgi:hypothetical protein